MQSRKELAAVAIARALSLRRKLDLSLDEAICPFDAGEKLGVETRLIDLPSMEGMYIADKDDPKIIISCLRPPGRRTFTCAHELGHHVFGHGAQFDELRAEQTEYRKSDPKEHTADTFAAFFLMPKATIDSGISKRGFRYGTLQPREVYALANWLGVGYGTLVYHLRYGISAILHEQTQRLLSAEPRKIRAEFLGRSTTSNLHIVDTNWLGRPIDCEVGDYLIVPREIGNEGRPLIRSEESDVGNVLEIIGPGIGRVFHPSGRWSSFVRASRRSYSGRCCFRFEEEEEQ